MRTFPSSMQHGFTLVEVMIVAAIFAILLGVGMPSFNNSLKDKRISGLTSEFISAVYVARNEALTRRADITLDEATNGWQAGWSIQRGNEVLHRFSQDDGDVSVRFLAADDTEITVSSLEFRPNGKATYNGGTAVANLRLLVCDDRPSERGRTLTLSPLGAIQNAMHEDGSACNE